LLRDNHRPLAIDDRRDSRRTRTVQIDLYDARIVSGLDG
jgi:hypothetical protein